jgi:hypothetical protein
MLKDGGSSFIKLSSKMCKYGPTILDGIGIEWWSLKSLWSRFKALKLFGTSIV